MNEEELIEFLRENLTIEVETHYGSYGDKDLQEVIIKVGGEYITSDYL